MNYLYYMLVIELLFLVVSGAKNYNFFPNLPAGEYKVNYIAVIRNYEEKGCNVQLDHFIYKTSRNTSELRGNTTFKTPFDDSYTFNMNFAVKDSIGGWKENAIIYRSPKACTFLKKTLGLEWSVYWERMGVNYTNCPLPSGFYVSKGFDLTGFVSRTSFPKVLFYGTYSVRLHFTDKNNNQCGSTCYIIDVLRPWENV